MIIFSRLKTLNNKHINNPKIYSIMKKLITLAVMLMLAASASAQSNNETQRKPKGPFSFGVGYDFGYFVAENVKYDDGTNFRANWKRGIHLINHNFSRL